MGPPDLRRSRSLSLLGIAGRRAHAGRLVPEAIAAWQAGTSPDYADPYTMQDLAPTHPVVDHAVQNPPGVWTLSPIFGAQEWWSVIDERYLKAPATALARRVTHGGVNMATVVANETTHRILLPFTWQTQHQLNAWQGWHVFADAVKWAAEGQQP